MTKLAVAAVVIIAGAIGLSLCRTTGSGIALADVVARVEQIKAFSFQSDIRMTVEGAPDDSGGEHARTLTSQEYGRRTVFERRDPNGGVTHSESYWLLPKRALVVINPEQRNYMRTELDEAGAQRMAKSWNDPCWMLKKVQGCRHERLGRSRVDGVEVEGFRTTDPNYVGDSRAEQVEVKIWVDVKTELPVRLEEDVASARMHVHTTLYDYRWDVRAEAADFEPVIPQDYKPMPGVVTKWPALTEEIAIQGLKQGIELLGHYPEMTDFPAYGSSALEKFDTPAALRLKEEVKGLTEDEKANRLVEVLLPMHCLRRFLAGLQFDKKDPAYYGKTVTPKDADKVLMRWKVSDTEYRVIFGDLHVETVSPEKLAELEKTLPKQQPRNPRILPGPGYLCPQVTM